MSIGTSIGLGTALAVGAVAAAGTAAAAVVSANAKSAAIKAQQAGLNRQQQLVMSELDPQAVNDLAKNADLARAKARLQAQQDIDPELAQARTLSKQQILQNAEIPQSARQSTQLATELFNENKNEDPRMSALKTALLDNAAADLKAGATLPPEFQAELVRAGLSSGASAGIAPDKRTVGGTVGRVLGLAGLQLQQQRQNQAASLASTAQNLTNSRASILASVFPAIRNEEVSNAQQAASTLGVADSQLPEAGLSGSDVANLKIAQVNALSGIAGKKAGLSAQSALNSGAETAGLIGAGTSAVSGLLSAYTGAKTPSGGTVDVSGI